MLQGSRGAPFLCSMMLIFVRQKFVIWFQYLYQNPFWQVFFLVEVLFKACYHVPASLANIAGIATWASNLYTTLLLSSSFTLGFKDGRKVFCFRNVTTGCIWAFERFNSSTKLSVGKPQYCIIKSTFAGEFSLFASSLLTFSLHGLTIFSITAEIISL